MSTATNIALVGSIGIGSVNLYCMGLYEHGHWKIVASWMQNGEDSLDASRVFTALFGKTFDPDRVLPAISLQMVSGELVPGQSFTFTCTSQVDWQRPFGIPTGFNISDLNLKFQYTSQNPSSTQLSGKFEIASIPASLTGYFQDASPVFLLVDEIPTLQLSQISEQFIGSLPTGILDLTLDNNQIYYLAEGASTTHLPGLPTTLESGLNISSSLTLVLAGHTFPTINLTASISDEITIDATFQESIDFTDFLTLTAVDDLKPGPSISLHTGSDNSSLRLDCGFTFLGEDFGTAGMSITKGASGQACLSATLSYDHTIGPFEDPSLSMTYDHENGFQITNWPAITAQNLIDAAEIKKQLSNINQSDCGKAVDIAFDQAMATEFTISPEFTTEQPEGAEDGDFYITLTGFYTISTTSDIVVCSLPLPKLALSFSTPSDFSFDTISSQIGQTITSNAAAIVRQLYEDKSALAEFMLVFVGRQALKRLATQLCSKSQQSLNRFLNKLTGSGSAGTLGALAAAGTALTALGCGASSGATDDKSPNVSALPAPSIASSQYSGGKWRLSWGAISDDDYYQYYVTNSSQTIISSIEYTQDTSASLNISTFEGAPYTFHVIAWAKPGLHYNSPAATIQMDQLKAITSISLQINGTYLQCAFARINEATGYNLRVLDTTGSTIRSLSTFTTSAETITFEIPIVGPPAIPHDYKIGIICTGGTGYLPSKEFLSTVQTLPWGVGYSQIGSTFITS